MAVVGAVVVGLAIAVPTAVIPTPLFGRAIAVTWWSYPTVAISALLGGLLLATYVRPLAGVEAPVGADSPSRVGLIGGVVSFLAVGCPVCNKLVLLALGASGAVSWFAPIQPLLAVVSLGLLAVSVHLRLGGEQSCRIDGLSSQRG